jgi:hypothetical protein
MHNAVEYINFVQNFKYGGLTSFKVLKSFESKIRAFLNAQKVSLFFGKKAACHASLRLKQ